MKQKQKVQSILKLGDIKINGDRSWDIQVHNPKLYGRILAGDSMALGESYMDGWWDVDSLDQFFCHIFQAKLHEKVKNIGLLWTILMVKIWNMQNISRAFEIAYKHYDIGNAFFKNMLDKRLVYSCGYWRNAENLDQAQEAKLDLICRKLQLEPDMSVLDIGCGWGSLVKFASEKYGVKCVGINVSKEQLKYCNELCMGLPVEFRLQDYREVTEKFDRIISVGMFEHVGPKNYRTYMKVVYNCLKPDGLFLLHTISKNVTSKSFDPWTNKYIFPNAYLPSARQITTASEGLFVIDDWHSFGKDYDKTLMAWYKNFITNWDSIKENYSERFFRMWKYYLLSSTANFRTGEHQLWQIVFSREGRKAGYQSIR